MILDLERQTYGGTEQPSPRFEHLKAEPGSRSTCKRRGLNPKVEVNDSYVLRTMLATMGDGADSAYTGAQNSNTIDERVGFGHLRFKPPDPNHLGAGSYWGVYAYTANNGDIFDIPVGGNGSAEPSTITGWKFAATIDYDEFPNSPAVLLQLIDKCPAGGGEQVLKVSIRATHKARLRMKASEMATKFHGRCLWVRMSVAATGSFPLTAMQYGYTNSRDWHDM